MKLNKIITGVILLICLCANICSCKEKKQEAKETNESVSVNEIKEACEACGDAYILSVLSFDFEAMADFSRLEDQNGVEDACYESFDLICEDDWGYEFLYSSLYQAQYSSSNFVYDEETNEAKLDYRISFADYSDEDGRSQLRYVVTLEFSYDESEEIAYITNPLASIELYENSYNDYNIYLLRNVVIFPSVEEVTPTPTPVPPTPTPVPPTPTPEPVLETEIVTPEETQEASEE